MRGSTRVEIAGNGVDDGNNGFIDDDVHGWDFFYNDSNPIDDATAVMVHTAGTIGAAGNNALNVVGVSGRSKVMNIRHSPMALHWIRHHPCHRIHTHIYSIEASRCSQKHTCDEQFIWQLR